MAQVSNSITFSTYSTTGTTTPWQNGNSTPPFPTETYRQMGDGLRITNNSLEHFPLVGNNNAILWDKTALTSDVVIAEVGLGTINSTAEGPCIGDINGVGWQLLCNNASTRLYTLTTGGLLGAQVSTNRAALPTNSICQLRYSQSADAVEVWSGASIAELELAQTFAVANSANTTWYAGAFSRGETAGVLYLKSIYETAYSINTLTNPINVGQTFDGTSTGFTDGDGTVSYGSRTVVATFVGNAFSGIAAELVDGEVHIALPATAAVLTFTKAPASATITRNIPVPAGRALVIFTADLIDTDPQYLGKALADIGEPISVGDRGYIPIANGLIVHPDSRVEFFGAITAELIIHRVSDGKTYFYTLNTNGAGEIIFVTRLMRGSLIKGKILKGNFLKGKFL